jgi:hypothetical protein
MVDVLGATGSLLPVFSSSNARTDKPPVAPTGICDVQHFPLRVVSEAARIGFPTRHPMAHACRTR